MPVDVHWEDTAHTLIHAESRGTWTWNEYHAAIDEIASAMSQVAHRVDLINTRTADAHMPHGSAMPQFESALRRLPPNCGLVINVTTHPFARVIASIFTRLKPGVIGEKVYFVSSWNEAQTLIARHRAVQDATL